MLIVITKNKKLICLIFFSFALLLPPVQAGQLNVQFENDGLFNNDGNYTNGFSLAWESKPLLSHQSNLHADIPSLSKLQHKLRLPITQTHSAWGLKLSQRMWTPNIISIKEPQSDDRPYAGLLEIESHIADYGAIYAQKNWLSLGIMGPKSKAETVQKRVHSITGSTPPQGWQYQIEEQVTLQLAYEVDALFFRSQESQSKLFTNNQWEISGYSHIALGNFNTEASLGLSFRWGTQLSKTFGRLSSHFGHIGNTIQVVGSSNFSVFSRFQLGYRLSDLTIEGDLPYKSAVNIQHKQARATLGVNWAMGDFGITWSLNSYTRSYISDNKSWHSYGSFILSYAI